MSSGVARTLVASLLVVLVLAAIVARPRPRLDRVRTAPFDMDEPAVERGAPSIDR